jgi:hypothetical protein
MGHSQAFQWFSRFKAGRTLTDDDECSGRPASSSMPEMIERVLLTTPAFFRMSLWVVEPGFTPTTQKPELSPVNGKVRGRSFETPTGECAKEAT